MSDVESLRTVDGGWSYLHHMDKETSSSLLSQQQQLFWLSPSQPCLWLFRRVRRLESTGLEVATNQSKSSLSTNQHPTESAGLVVGIEDLFTQGVDVLRW